MDVIGVDRAAAQRIALITYLAHLGASQNRLASHFSIERGEVCKLLAAGRALGLGDEVPTADPEAAALVQVQYNRLAGDLDEALTACFEGRMLAVTVSALPPRAI